MDVKPVQYWQCWPNSDLRESTKDSTDMAETWYPNNLMGGKVKAAGCVLCSDLGGKSASFYPGGWKNWPWEVPVFENPRTSVALHATAHPLRTFC